MMSVTWTRSISPCSIALSSSVGMLRIVRKSQMSSSRKLSFGKQAAQVLADWRVWSVVLLYAGFCIVVDRIWGPRTSAIAAAPLGILAACVLARLDFDSADESLSFTLIRNDRFLCAMAGIMIVQGTEAIGRFPLLPWHWLYGEHIENHLSAIAVGSVFDWLSFLIAGWCIGTLMPRRALLASMAGVSIFLPIAITKLLTSEAVNREILTLAHATGLLSDPDWDLSLFRPGFLLGSTVGLLARAVLTIYGARLASSRAS